MELPAKRLESTRQSMTLRQKFTIADRFHRAAGYRTSRKHITGILLLVLALTSFQAPVWSRVQPAWVARYNDSLSRGTNEVIAMQFDPEGNVLIAGSSTSASGDYDYLVLKYGPDGSRKWVARYASTNKGDDRVRAMVVGGRQRW